MASRRICGKGFDGLSALATEGMQRDPLNGDV
jgi:hypothetical protein